MVTNEAVMEMAMQIGRLADAIAYLASTQDADEGQDDEDESIPRSLSVTGIR